MSYFDIGSSTGNSLGCHYESGPGQCFNESKRTASARYRHFRLCSHWVYCLHSDPSALASLDPTLRQSSRTCSATRHRPRSSASVGSPTLPSSSARPRPRGFRPSTSASRSYRGSSSKLPEWTYGRSRHLSDCSCAQHQLRTANGILHHTDIRRSD